MYLQRFAMVTPGAGLGRPLLRSVMEWVFTATQTHRLWLHVKDGNDRALHVYRTTGFTTEGKLREAFITPKGERCDAFILSILRAEWPSVAASATT
jgi:RimJ/RimL family protein N-acetyltransferase